MTSEHPSPPHGETVRAAWLARADVLLDSARRHASPGGGRIHFPGAEGGYGRAVDGLEGFARTFLLAGFRIAGARGEGVDELIAHYARGIVCGVDPEAPDRWVRMDEHAQAKVEAASIALVLDLTRPWIWDRLDAVTQQRVVDYLAPVVGDDTYPQTNWVWFRIVVQTFLRSVGGPWSADDIAADLARHDSFVREGGWLSDGAERSYDHYVGWALHVYPILWSRMSGAADLAAGRTGADIARLDAFLHDALALVGGDGSPLIQGRSLIYRFAAAAPFWAGVIADVPSHSPGRLRHAADRLVMHFAGRGAPDADGILTMGWHGTWRALAQSYSGPGSPYWAVKGFLGLLLPADHPVWSAVAEPLPVEEGNVLRAIVSPGWIVSATAADGIVRVVNHGTDHAFPEARTADSPLYARLGYSTATSPILDERGWVEPLEQSVALVEADGRATHRTAMTLLSVRLQDDADGRVGIGASTWDAHLVTPAPATHRHGSGLAGEVTTVGTVTTTSIVRGASEVRIVVVGDLAPGRDADALRLRLGGWPLSGDEVVGGTDDTGSWVSSRGLSSGIRSITPHGVAGLVSRADADPLGVRTLVPTIEHAVRVGEPVVTLLDLAGGQRSAPSAAVDVDGATVTVTWPDGVRTVSRLTDSESPAPALRHHEVRRGTSHAIAKEQHA
ncbi:DUF2264 domain-containing protein [Microbacterium sp. cf332]|uniref:DUF2264 domain-containing protein n=1 Tax=Microbacterium sp. cf332 TaxID=1761804 RepID=UPI0008893CCF|nr:DUF2264 domain-containing protein [Microbacterium sp. cf332]SDQ29609.1 hypothetical protein SAMN04487847_1289 [Microbacterium sp. cf332]